MKAIVQRVSRGGVHIPNHRYNAEIGMGIVILLGITHADTPEDAEYLAGKIVRLRIFEDTEKKMNLSLLDVKGDALVISQFTIYGETAKGNRPSFTEAAQPSIAIPLYEKFVAELSSLIGEEKVRTGIFGAMMEVTIINDGPVTLTVTSKGG